MLKNTINNTKTNAIYSLLFGLFFTLPFQIYAEDWVFTLNCQAIGNASGPTSNDGIGEFTVGGGNPPYNFTLTSSSNSTNRSGMIPIDATTQLNDLLPGTYRLQVSDGTTTQNCTFVVGVQTCNYYSVEANVDEIDCVGDLGSILPTISGNPIPPVSYQWSNGATTLNLVDVPGGTYHLTITDGANCIRTLSVTLFSPRPIFINATPQNATDYQTLDGLVRLSTFGGTSSYRLKITRSDGVVVFNAVPLNPLTLGGLRAGNYTAMITNENGCTGMESFQIGVNECKLILEATSITAQCEQANNKLVATVTQGVGPYTFKWEEDIVVGVRENGTTENTSCLSDIGVGTYKVTVEDVVGCTKTVTVNVTGFDEITLDCKVIKNVTTVGGDQGEVEIMIGEGQPGFSATLTGFPPFAAIDRNPTFAGLTAGNYTFEVMDQRGCKKSCSFVITEPSCDFTITLADAAVPCGQTTGSLIAIPSGGAPPYSYLWDDANASTTAQVSNLPPGTYTVKITDNFGCTMMASAEVFEDVRDADGDGFFVGCNVSNPDCNDDDPNVFPGAIEICNQKDDNCDGKVDEGFDSDNDGVSDCVDEEVCDGKDNDGDGQVDEGFDLNNDGYPDCLDLCPDDPNKTVPGECGCGVREDTKDYDGDGVIGCKDGCPYDKNKIAGGNCGCGNPETPDSDGDGVYDCKDECPDNPKKSIAGTCGCDAPGITDVRLINFTECKDNSTATSEDDYFEADLYVYFDDAPKLGGLTIRGDIEAYYKFSNSNTSNLIIVSGQTLKANGSTIKIILEYKGNEKCHYVYEGPSAQQSCSQAVCDVPQNLASLVQGNKVTLSWDAVSNGQSYEYKYRAIGQKDWIAQWTDQTSSEICDLLPKEDYEFHVRALCLNGYSSPYASQTFRTGAINSICKEGLNTTDCIITEIKIIDIRQCHDRGTFYQSDDYFYADVLVFYENMPTKGYLILEGNVNESIEVDKITNPQVHHFQKLKFTEGNGILDLTASFTEKEDCAENVRFGIPRNPCHNGKLTPIGDWKVTDEEKASLSTNPILAIGPNPTVNTLNVTYDCKYENQSMMLEVYNIYGQKQLTQNLPNITGEERLYVGSLDNGMYYLSLSSGALRKTVKFIKEDMR